MHTGTEPLSEDDELMEGEEEEVGQGSGDWGSNASQKGARSARGRKRRTEPILTKLENGEFAHLTPKEYRSFRRYLFLCSIDNAFCYTASRPANAPSPAHNMSFKMQYRLQRQVGAVHGTSQPRQLWQGRCHSESAPVCMSFVPPTLWGANGGLAELEMWLNGLTNGTRSGFCGVQAHHKPRVCQENAQEASRGAPANASGGVHPL